MNIKKNSLCFLTALIALNASAYSFSNDFQSDTPGQAPAAPATPNGAGEIYIVDANTTVTDPFGGEGNQSLYLKDTDSSAPRVTWQLPDITAGELTFDMYMPDIESTAAGQTWQMYLYGSSGSGNKPTISVAGNKNDLIFYDGAASITNTDGLPMDQAHSFRIVFEEDRTFTVWVDGQQISYTPSGDTEAKTLFDWRGTEEALTSLQFLAGSNAPASAQVFIDNLTFIPEPSHFSLMTGALVLIGALSGRRLARR